MLNNTPAQPLLPIPDSLAQGMRRLPGEQWQPSNSTDGYSFIEFFCSNCERDRDQDCEILARSFCGEAVEWRHTEEKGCFCMAYVPLGESLPEVPCPHTLPLVFDVQKAKGGVTC